MLATPGGVASRQVLVPSGRTNSCQKLLWLAAEPPITATAHVPVAVASEVARDGGVADGAGAVACPAALPHPAASIAAASSREVGRAGRFMRTSARSGRRQRAGRRRRIWWRWFRGRDRC